MLVLKHVSKTFPGVKALKDVSLTFNKGQVHALLGENGAGKTTLIRIISGYQQPDHGAEMLISTACPMSVAVRRTPLKEAFRPSIRTFKSCRSPVLLKTSSLRDCRRGARAVLSAGKK